MLTAVSSLSSYALQTAAGSGLAASRAVSTLSADASQTTTDPTTPTTDATTAEEASQQQSEKLEVAELEATDREVRAHEAAHLAAAGGLATGGASFTYETGPDGQRYAVAGEVGISISSGSTPEETLRNAEQVRRAALSPADPSAQDLKVAAMASQMAATARIQIAEERMQEYSASTNSGSAGQSIDVTA